MKSVNLYHNHLHTHIYVYINERYFGLNLFIVGPQFRECVFNYLLNYVRGHNQKSVIRKFIYCEHLLIDRSTDRWTGFNSH